MTATLFYAGKWAGRRGVACYVELAFYLENPVFHSEQYYEGDKVRQGNEQLAKSVP